MTKEVLEVLKETVTVLKEYDEKQTIEVYNNIWIGVLNRFRENPQVNSLEINFYKELTRNKSLPNEQIDKVKKMLMEDGFKNVSGDNNQQLILLMTRSSLYQLLEKSTQKEEPQTEEKPKKRVRTMHSALDELHIAAQLDNVF